MAGSSHSQTKPALQKETKLHAANHDIIVIGGSAGGIDVIGEILSGLSPELAAAVFVVVHTGDGGNYLADILSKQTQLPVLYAADREPIELGKIYVAPPDRHLLVKQGEMRVVFGPKENNFRPALDPLFRTAATTYGGRVIGVVVSGLLDDGTHGLLQIKRAGGITVAQTPAEAMHPGMPQSAIDRAAVDHVASAGEIGPLLNQLVSHGTESAGPLGGDELDVAQGAVSALRLKEIAPPTPFICPECKGALWETNEGELMTFRCHVGHGFTADTLLSLQAIEIEQALWSAVRAFEERAALQRRSAENTAMGNAQLRKRLLDGAKDQQRMADVVRQLLVGPELHESPVGQSVREEYNGHSGLTSDKGKNTDITSG